MLLSIDFKRDCSSPIILSFSAPNPVFPPLPNLKKPFEKSLNPPLWIDDEFKQQSRIKQDMCRQTEKSGMYRTKTSCGGSVLLIVIFLLALTAVLVIGMLHLTTEELLQAQNQMEMARAWMAAEAGMNDAIVRIRQDIFWNTGFTNKPFFEDSYTVSIAGTPPLLTVDSMGRTASGYQTRLVAEVRTGLNPPYPVTIQSFRINP